MAVLLLDPGGGFTSKNRRTAVSEVKRPLPLRTRNRVGSETVTNLQRLYICNGHSPTEKSVRSGVTIMYVTAVAVAAGQIQRFYSGVGIFNWYYLSSPPQIPRGSRFVLEEGD